MADEEELQDVANGNAAVQTLLEDDDTHLSAECQGISQSIRGFTSENFHQID
jgi:hypothetical protein